MIDDIKLGWVANTALYSINFRPFSSFIKSESNLPEVLYLKRQSNLSTTMHKKVVE